MESVSSSEFAIETDSKYHFRTDSESMKTEWIDLLSKYRMNCRDVPIQIDCPQDHQFADAFTLRVPLVSGHQFTLIFIAIIERLLNSTVPSDVADLITRYVNVTKRVDWFDDAVPHSKNIDIADKMNITRGGYTFGTVLCGDGEPLDRSRYTKYEVVFKINKMDYGFYIGYVFGSIQEIDFEEILGWGSNKKNSVGIGINRNKFTFYDDYHHRCMLKCQSENGPSTFPKQRQYWRVSWDLIDKEMEISLLNQQETDWILMTSYAMKQEHFDVIPAITLLDKDNSITLLSE